MAVYYLDTSALIKYYAQETGSSWITKLIGSSANHELFTVRITGPEMMSALLRKVRTKEISQSRAISLIRKFRTDWELRYQMLEVTPTLADHAMQLVEEHSLRGYDAVHLAAALELHNFRQQLQLSALTFVSADSEQLNAAQTEGLQTENPNLHR